jgi:endonuclease/exonuclease/phosphatase family metal-dependent hydrolase
MPLTVVTWNLKGSAGVDVPAVVAHLEAAAADVVFLQEVQWHQAQAIARRLRVRTCRWGFKHWPVRNWPEGMAVLGVTRPARVRTRAVTRPWELWDWRRRIVQAGIVDLGGHAVTVVNVHFSSAAAADRRLAEAATVLQLVGRSRREAVVAGDMNDLPDAPLHVQLTGAGLLDAWSVLHADGGASNWRGWKRGTPKEPTQRLDYVYVSTRLEPVAVTVPRFGDADFARFASISDHLPVTATLRVPE